MTKISVAFVPVAALLVSSCGSSFDGPDEGDLTEFLTMEMDEGMAVDDIEIVAAQNVGDEIEPLYRTRSNIDLVLEEDFVDLVEFVDDRPVVKVVAKAGTEIPAILFTRSEPIGDDWDVNMEKIDIKKRRGRPISEFENYIIEGSAEEKSAREAANAKMKEAEREMLAARDAARGKFFGNWSSSRPMMMPNNRVWQSQNQPLTVSLNLKAGTDGAGSGTMTLKSLSDSSNSATGPITYVIQEGEGMAVISVPGDIRVPAGDSWVSPSTWNLYSNGRMELSNNKRWNIDLSPPSG